MSIQDEIAARVNEGRLVEFEPIPPMSKYRLVFLLPAINEQVSGPWEDGSDDAVQMPNVRADLENFIVGGHIVAAFGRGPDANFRRLEVRKRKQARTWEIRTIQPPPGYRLLGFFAAQDVFVGVDLVPRDQIDFETDIKRAQAEWDKLFSAYKPIVSENINDYISEKVVRLRR